MDPNWREAAAWSQRQVLPPEPESEPVRAVFEGELVDIATGEKIVGAQVALVKPPDSDAVWHCRGRKAST